MRNPRDVIIGLVLICFCVLVYVMSFPLPDQVTGGGLAPASFPRALAFLIIVLSILLIIQGLVKFPEAGQGSLFGPFFGQMAAFFLMIVIYTFLMPEIGYVVSTLVFLSVSFVLIMPDRSLRNIMTGVAFTISACVLVYVIFGIFLSVPLIEGPVDESLRNCFYAVAGGG